MKKYKVFINGIITEIEENEFLDYNVIVNKSNGYSHDFLAIEKFEKEKHFTSSVCPFTKRVLNYVPTHLTTNPITSFVKNTSSVTFS